MHVALPSGGQIMYIPPSLANTPISWEHTCIRPLTRILYPPSFKSRHSPLPHTVLSAVHG